LQILFTNLLNADDKYSKRLNLNEEKIFKLSLKSGDQKKWARSIKGIEKINDKVAKKIIIWRWLIADDGVSSKKDLENFYKSSTTWPKIDKVKAKIESKNAFVACQNSNCKVSKAAAFSICESCEEVTEIDNSKISKYLSSFADKIGMKYKKYNLEFFGLCKKCK